jgi:hypothetical protein
VPAGVVEPVQSRPPAPSKKKLPKPSTDVAVAALPPTTTTTEVAAPPLPPAPVIPEGKGMWIWKPQLSDGGNAAVIVARAKAAGLTHLFVRTGSTWDGFQNADFLDRILPVAHDAGLKVYGWDFPKLADIPVDVSRAMTALTYRAPGDHKIDGFAADIETLREGTQMSAQAADYYGKALRVAAGPSALLIVAVPNPTPQMRVRYPYGVVVPSFDAIAPMIYWLNREPVVDTATAMSYLKQFGKPLMPIGQAYDGGPEGGRPGVPSPEELLRFMSVSQDWGAVAVSFWSWQHANAPAWDAIKAGPKFLRQPG